MVYHNFIAVLICYHPQLLPLPNNYYWKQTNKTSSRFCTLFLSEYPGKIILDKIISHFFHVTKPWEDAWVICNIKTVLLILNLLFCEAKCQLWPWLKQFLPCKWLMHWLTNKGKQKSCIMMIILNLIVRLYSSYKFGFDWKFGGFCVRIICLIQK